MQRRNEESRVGPPIATSLLRGGMRGEGREVGDIVSPDHGAWIGAFDEDEWEELYGTTSAEESTKEDEIA